MRTLALAVSATLLSATSLPALAESMTALRYGGNDIAFRTLPPGSVVLSVVSRGRGLVRLPESAASPANRRPIIVDGVLIEMDEATIRTLIRAGTFVVVHPGTNVPWDSARADLPSYPPVWANVLF